MTRKQTSIQDPEYSKLQGCVLETTQKTAYFGDATNAELLEEQMGTVDIGGQGWEATVGLLE